MKYPTFEEAKAYIPVLESMDATSVGVPPKDYAKVLKSFIAKEHQSHAYCGCCKEIRPIRFDDMGGKDVSNTFFHPTDIVCNECHYIIATLYSNKE